VASYISHVGGLLHSCFWCTSFDVCDSSASSGESAYNEKSTDYRPLICRLLSTTDKGLSGMMGRERPGTGRFQGILPSSAPPPPPVPPTRFPGSPRNAGPDRSTPPKEGSLRLHDSILTPPLLCLLKTIKLFSPDSTTAG
jgi:hypothetical protein